MFAELCASAVAHLQWGSVGRWGGGGVYLCTCSSAPWENAWLKGVSGEERHCFPDLHKPKSEFAKVNLEQTKNIANKQNCSSAEIHGFGNDLIMQLTSPNLLIHVCEVR